MGNPMPVFAASDVKVVHVSRRGARAAIYRCHYVQSRTLDLHRRFGSTWGLDERIRTSDRIDVAFT